MQQASHEVFVSQFEKTLRQNLMKWYKLWQTLANLRMENRAIVNFTHLEEEIVGVREFRQDIRGQ